MPHVLIAEDDSVMRKLYALVFDREPDLDVTIVEGSWDSLPVTQDWSLIDLALVDQYLEHYRGSELLAHLEAYEPHVRRVMFTGDTTISKESAHAHRVIHKPAGPREIIPPSVRSCKVLNPGIPDVRVRELTR